MLEKIDCVRTNIKYEQLANVANTAMQMQTHTWKAMWPSNLVLESLIDAIQSSNKSVKNCEN